MAGYSHGMNVEAVKDVSRRLTRIADTDIQHLISHIDQTVQLAMENWSGTDSQQFHNEWTGTHRLSLQALKAAILSFANRASDNASSQEDTSHKY